MTLRSRLAELLALLLRLSWGAAAGLFRTFSRAWRRLGNRGRLAGTLAVLTVFSIWTGSAPALSGALSGLALLLVAGAGLWMIATAPFGRR